MNYKMPVEFYHGLWDKIEKYKDRDFDHGVIDRWLSIYCGITALNNEIASNTYPFIIRKPELLTLFLLRYS